MSESVVLVTKDNRLATVTLNRPEKLNALSAELRSTFCTAMQKLRADPEVGCVIITGAGRAFCAGLDLRGFRRRNCVRWAAPISFRLSRIWKFRLSPR